MRCPGQPASGRSRFGVFLAWRPARSRTFAAAIAPLRFFASRTRCGAARRAGDRRLRFRSSSPLFGGLDACDFKLSVRLTIAGAGDSRRIRLNRAHRRSVTSSATASFVRHSKSVMHRRTSLAAAFRYALRAFAAWPGGWSFPFSPGGAPGVHALRRFAPENGWPLISDPAGPTCLFILAARPD